MITGCLECFDHDSTYNLIYLAKCFRKVKLDYINSFNRLDQLQKMLIIFFLS